MDGWDQTHMARIWRDLIINAFKEPLVTSQFKIGDLVSFVSAEQYVAGIGIGGLDGKKWCDTFEVVYADPNWVDLKSEVRDHAGVFSHRLKHVVTEEPVSLPAIKAGDTVRYVDLWGGMRVPGVGVVREVMSPSYTGVSVFLECGRYLSTRMGDTIELVERPVAPVAPVDDHATRKGQPVTRGVLDYFPDAIKAVAECSRAGSVQHHPTEEMHWARAKSSDHADCVVRHLMDRGTMDKDGVRHSAKAAWRALALLQEELEAAGAPKARGAK